MNLQEMVVEFNRRIQEGELEVERPVCICGSDKSRSLRRYDFQGLWNPVVICRDCGLIYASPRLSGKSYKWFYRSDIYRLLYEGNDYILQAIEKYNLDYGKHIFTEIDSIASQRGLSKVVEIGCGGGWNLLNFTQSGYHASGYDYSTELIKLGQNKGLDLKHGSINDLREKYDIIILNHVLEHFDNPIQSIAKIVEHLTSKGLIYISVPNMDRYHCGQFQNAHLYYFTPRTLLHYIVPLGLRPVSTGIAQKEHFFSLLERNEALTFPISLRGEYRRMMMTIWKYRARRATIYALDKLGLKHTIKNILQPKNK